MKNRIMALGLICALVMLVGAFIVYATDSGSAPASAQNISTTLEDAAIEYNVLKLFWRDGCPHCEEEKKDFLPYVQDNYPDVKIELYDVLQKSGYEELEHVSSQLGFDPGSVPVTVINGNYVIGYGTFETTGRRIEALILNKTSDQFIVEVPFLGTVDLQEFMGDMGIPLSTMVLGLMDGFNPCAFFVLAMLLSFMIHARSRFKMLLIGLTFVFISGLVYFMFMTALFSAIRAVNEITILAMAGGAIALTIAVINLKDVFFFKKGVSLSIPESKKPALYKRMRGLIKSQSLLEIFLGTIILAFVANTYELLCTAGIPLVYGNLLNVQQLDVLTSILYIALYNVFYVLPLLTIVIVFVKTLGSRKLSQSQGELLKSISGFMMLGFGVFLITNPTILSNIFITGSLIVVAIIISLVIHTIKKRIIPENEPTEESEIH